MNLLVVIKQK